MKNGIVINGVKYEAVETTTFDECNGCAFDMGPLCRKHCPCHAFHPLNVIFKKPEDQNNGKEK